MPTTLAAIIRGTPVPVLTALPDQHGLANSECCICFRQYNTVDNPNDPNELPESPVQMRCKHFGGARCLVEWARRNPRCPTCNTHMGDAVARCGYVRKLLTICDTKGFRDWDDELDLVTYRLEINAIPRRHARDRVLTLLEALMCVAFTVSTHIVYFSIYCGICLGICFGFWAVFNILLDFWMYKLFGMRAPGFGLYVWWGAFMILEVVFILPFIIIVMSAFGIALFESWKKRWTA